MLTSKVALVSGGSRGIGRATAVMCAREGARVAVLGRNESFLNEAVSELHRVHGGPTGHHLAVVCDVADPIAVRAVEQVVGSMGPPTVLVNAAGIARDSLLLRAKDSDIQQQLGTNLLGPMYLCRAALRPMMKTHEGCIVNIGSVVGLTGNAGQAAYSAAKAGLVGFSKTLAKEVGSRGIRVNVVAPGFIDTDMTKGMGEEARQAILERLILKRFGEPQDVVEAVRFLLACQYVTGQVIVVDGGMSL